MDIENNVGVDENHPFSPYYLLSSPH